MRLDNNCRRSLIALAMLVAAPPAAMASGWEVEPEVTLSADYNDNPALQPSFLEPDSTLSSVALFRADLVRQEPRSRIEIRPRIQTTYYPEEQFKDLNRTEWYLNGNYNYFEQTWSFTSGLSYDKQSVLSSEDSDPTNPGDSGSGNFLQVDDERERFTITPAITWQATPLDTFNVAASFSRIDHELDFTGRADFDTYAGSISYDRALDNRQSIGLFASAYNTDSESTNFVLVCLADGSVFDPNNSCVPPGTPVDQLGLFLVETEGKFRNESSGRSLNVSYRYRWDERSQININVGQQTTEIESSTVGPVDSLSLSSEFESTQYLVGYTSRTERIDWEVNASRSVQPSSNGNPSDKTQFQGSITTRHTRRLSSSVAALWFEQTSRSASVRRSNEFYRIDATLSYRFSQRISVGATYIFRNRDPSVVSIGDASTPSDLQNAERRSNTFNVSLRYKFGTKTLTPL